ncbi:hypothetical protein B0H16DRAFT_1783222 [Mycena metata]|uniref:Uncharacterized protein n=1 Tax=Mycena metata TaxID=1033252 RepID=A0AAD7KGN9_9AGAR|nr:hypothetical protein B0H16DRAFT_1783222 [Mycena metata]
MSATPHAPHLAEPSDFETSARTSSRWLRPRVIRRAVWQEEERERDRKWGRVGLGGSGPLKARLQRGRGKARKVKVAGVSKRTRTNTCPPCDAENAHACEVEGRSRARRAPGGEGGGRGVCACALSYRRWWGDGGLGERTEVWVRESPTQTPYAPGYLEQAQTPTPTPGEVKWTGYFQPLGEEMCRGRGHAPVGGGEGREMKREREAEALGTLADAGLVYFDADAVIGVGQREWI